MSIVWDSKKEIFIVDINLRCRHCGFEYNPRESNCCGDCGKSLRFSKKELTLYDNGIYLLGAERWKVYDSHKEICPDEMNEN